MSQKLESLDTDFKLHHYAVVDALDDEGTLAKEQETLDQHDNDIAWLAVRIEQLIATSDLASESGTRKIALRRLSCVKSNLSAIRSAISELTGDPAETHLLHHYQEQLSDFKKELGDIRHSLLSLGLKEGDELEVSATTLDKEIFDSGLQVKKLLFTPHARPPPEPSVESPGSMGVKLPKLDVPTFDGNILNWQTFWEQFCVAVHDRSSLSDAVYLRHALKDGSAKKVIEGLSRSGEHYIEAIECLRSRYNRPRIIHQTHVRRIMEIAPIKEGSGKELRYLHDVAQQHLRALKAMGHDPADSFITSLLELKLDQNTMFEWQRFSQESTSVPPYKDLLNFINLRAQASESTASETKKVSQPPHRKPPSGRSVASFAASASNPQSNCILCENERHPLYVCPHFKSLPRDKMISTIRDNELCMNCLRQGHFSKQCKSLNKCRKYQKHHHTLIHSDKKENTDQSTPIVSSNTAAGVTSNTLLMTCQVIVKSLDGSSIRARALLDSASSTSFVSERLVQNLCLPRTRQDVHISGIAGLSHHSPLQSVATFNVSSTYSPSKSFNITAVVIPRVTCDLPIKPIYFDSRWTHLSDLSLADPDFGRPGTIDILLGVDVYADVLLQGRRCGPSGTPVAFETQFGWVLAGRTGSHVYSHLSVTSHHVSVTSGDDLLRKFWEIEENPKSQSSLSVEERSVVEHFNKNHTRTESGRFIVPLPKRPESKPLGESRSQAVRQFMSLERSLHLKNQFQEFSAVVEEYFEMDHAELVPVVDLQKLPDKVFYLPMHAVRKEHSTTTKLRVVFDASAKSATGVSLNDLLLVGPTVHPPLVDILLRFRSHRVALTADVSKMYRAVELTPPDRDLHRFVWRKSPDEPLRDYRMTRVTFGVSASSFAANMSMKQNALDFASEFPQAVKAVEDSFYVDDSLTGADSVHDAIKLQKQLQSLFLKGGFLLRKWNSSESAVLKHISSDLKDSQSMQLMPDEDQYTKTLGIEWNARQDHFRLTVADLPPMTNITKRALVSDVAKTFNVLGWFSPTIIKVKILLQRLWERKVEWDDPVPLSIKDAWLQWRSELPLLTSKHIPRCYFDKKSRQKSMVSAMPLSRPMLQ